MKIRLFDELPKDYRAIRSWPDDADYVRSALTKAEVNEVIMPCWATQHGHRIYALSRDIQNNGALPFDYCNPHVWAPNPFDVDDVPENAYLHYPHTSLRPVDRIVSKSSTEYNPRFMHWRYDLGSHEFRKFFVEKLAHAEEHGGILGWWIDQLGWKDDIREVKRAGDLRTVPLVNPRTAAEYALSELIEERLTLADAMSSTLSGELLVNIGTTLSGREIELVRLLDGAIVEGGGFFWSRKGYLGVARWMQDLDTCAQIKNAGRTLALLGKPLDDPGSILDIKRHYFVLASFLLVAGIDDMFRYDYGETADLTRKILTDWNLGAPRETYKQVGTLYQRDFASKRLRVDPINLKVALIDIVDIEPPAPQDTTEAIAVDLEAIASRLRNLP